MTFIFYFLYKCLFNNRTSSARGGSILLAAEQGSFTMKVFALDFEILSREFFLKTHAQILREKKGAS